MKKLKITVLMVGLMSLTSVHAHSLGYYNQPGYDYDSAQNRVNNRQSNQKWRIEQGIDSGLLTPWETRKLARQQYKIARLETHFKRDGWLNRKEKRILHWQLDQASRRIYDLKHNPHYLTDGHDETGYNHRHYD